jgi:hypothetical protein
VSGIWRRLWWVLVAIAVLFGLFGLTDVLGGATADPGIPLAVAGLSPTELEAESVAAYRMFDFTVRTQGLLLILMGVVLTAILLIPYRQGQRSAWRLMWVLPAWSLSILGLYLVFGLAVGQAPAPPMISGPIVAVISGLILLADRPRFVGAVVEVADRHVEPAWTGR